MKEVYHEKLREIRCRAKLRRVHGTTKWVGGWVVVFIDYIFLVTSKKFQHKKLSELEFSIRPNEWEKDGPIFHLCPVL